MVTDKIKQIEVTKAKLAKLESTVARQLKKELSALHSKYGFESLGAFVAALQEAASGKKAAAVALLAAGPDVPPVPDASAATAR